MTYSVLSKYLVFFKTHAFVYYSALMNVTAIMLDLRTVLFSRQEIIDCVRGVVIICFIIVCLIRTLKSRYQ